MKASDILTSTLAAFLFSSHPKREWIEAHLNYHASAYNGGGRTVTLQAKTKSNTADSHTSSTKKYITQNLHTKDCSQVQSPPTTSGLQMEWEYSGRMGRDGKARK